MKRNVSVVVVSWNARHYLHKCLCSLRDARSECVTEVMVIDNASSDGSAECVESQFPEVTLIRASSNLGFARANNLGMQKAKGSYFALINSDALVHRGCLDALAGFLDQHPEVGLAGPKVVGGDGLLQRTCRQPPGPWNTFCRALALDRVFGSFAWLSGYEVPAALHETPHEAEVLSGCFCMVRHEAVDEVGGMDEQFFFYGEDLDWCKRLRDAGWALAYVPSATATHFGGGSTSKAPLRFSVEILRATLKYWRKHYGRLGEVTCRALLVLHHGLRFLLRATRWGIGIARSPEEGHKLREDAVCLRWLFFRTEVDLQ